MTLGASPEPRPVGAEGRSDDYLHACLALHGELSVRLFKRRQELDQVAATTSEIRSRRRLTYDDINTIKSQEHWSGDQFWRWPSREEIGADLEHESWDLWNLPRKEGAAIGALLRLFRNIEPVSVVLRFVDPKNYGILSPPVEKLLELGPSSSPQAKYESYVENLRDLRNRRGFDAAADVDMALWVLQVGILEKHLQGHESLVQKFHSDRMLREIRVANLTESLFGGMSRADLAEALLPTNPQLAAQIAGIEFERAVKSYAGVYTRAGVGAVVRGLYRARRLTALEKVRWGEAAETRNKAVHSRVGPRPEEVGRLLEAMRSAIGKAGP